MGGIQGKIASLTLDDPELERICHALSSPVRLDILRLLGRKSMSIGELAQALDLPMSSAALAVQVLREAQIITTESQPGARGTLKLCTRRLDRISVELAPRDDAPGPSMTLQMPIGGFSTVEGVQPTCGLAGPEGIIGRLDVPGSFYLPERFRAQLLWMQQGFLEYRFWVPEAPLIWLELSFEACSEAPMFRDPWKSSIAVEMNGCRLGVWTCPCDCGGRRGVLNPDWWGDANTQFGFLKTWRVDKEGSFLDGERIGNTRIGDLGPCPGGYLGVRIGVPADAEYAGGLNLFGEGFGDYPQALKLRMGFDT